MPRRPGRERARSRGRGASPGCEGRPAAQWSTNRGSSYCTMRSACRRTSSSYISRQSSGRHRDDELVGLHVEEPHLEVAARAAARAGTAWRGGAPRLRRRPRGSAPRLRTGSARPARRGRASRTRQRPRRSRRTPRPGRCPRSSRSSYAVRVGSTVEPGGQPRAGAAAPREGRGQERPGEMEQPPLLAPRLARPPVQAHLGRRGPPHHPTSRRADPVEVALHRDVARARPAAGAPGRGSGSRPGSSSSSTPARAQSVAQRRTVRVPRVVPGAVTDGEQGRLSSTWPPGSNPTQRSYDAPATARRTRSIATAEPSVASRVRSSCSMPTPTVRATRRRGNRAETCRRSR